VEAMAKWALRDAVMGVTRKFSSTGRPQMLMFGNMVLGADYLGQFLAREPDYGCVSELCASDSEWKGWLCAPRRGGMYQKRK
jgi:hypothetical protein